MHFTISRKDGTSQIDTLKSSSYEVVTIEEAVAPPVDWDPVGYCIYCGSDADLSREHIIPFGLSGEHVLPAASCKTCATKTSAIERKVLRGPFRSVRLLRELKSRSKHSEAPRVETLEIVKNGRLTSVQLPLKEFPLFLHFAKFGVPRALTGSAGTGITMTGGYSVLFGPQPEEVAKLLGAERIMIPSGRYEPVPFAQMLAKIAYGFAFATGQFRGRPPRCEIIPAILDRADDIGNWVGTIDGPIKKYPGQLHRIQGHRDEAGGFLLVEVQLFADSETPTYGVLLRDSPKP